MREEFLFHTCEQKSVQFAGRGGADCGRDLRIYFPALGLGLALMLVLGLGLGFLFP